MIPGVIGSPVVYLCEVVQGRRRYMAHSLLSGIVRAETAEDLAHELDRVLHA